MVDAHTVRRRRRHALLVLALLALGHVAAAVEVLGGAEGWVLQSGIFVVDDPDGEVAAVLVTRAARQVRPHVRGGRVVHDHLHAGDLGEAAQQVEFEVRVQRVLGHHFGRIAVAVGSVAWVVALPVLGEGPVEVASCLSVPDSIHASGPRGEVRHDQVRVAGVAMVVLGGEPVARHLVGQQLLRAGLRAVDGLGGIQIVVDLGCAPQPRLLAGDVVAAPVKLAVLLAAEGIALRQRVRRVEQLDRGHVRMGGAALGAGVVLLGDAVAVGIKSEGKHAGVAGGDALLLVRRRVRRARVGGEGQVRDGAGRGGRRAEQDLAFLLLVLTGRAVA